ncbi:hypothetical protein [Haloarchaeobius sp. TZWWS8]|uniref:hypothetical protein n=1 Tax=Haloarchaeobius sp. TZWWS8 TaxID=3446121 RepID=UPI003EB81227
MPSERAALAMLAVVVLVGTALPAAMASSPPQPLCEVCGEEFERAANQDYVQPTVERSTATLAVDENGDGQWTARLTLDEATAEWFRENEMHLEYTINEALNQKYGETTDGTPYTYGLDGQTLTIEYEEPDVASRGVGGTLLVDRFHSFRGSGYEFNVAEFEIRGPDGTIVSNDPPGSPNAGDEAATWARPDTPPYSVDFSKETFVAFHDEGGVAGRVAAEATIVERLGPRFLKDTLLLSLVPMALFISGLGSVRKLGRYDDWSIVRAAALPLAVVGLGLVLAASMSQWRLLEPLVPALPFLFVPMAALVSADWQTPLVAVATVVAGLAIQFLFAGMFRVEGVPFLAGWGEVTAMAIPALLFFPLGAFADRGNNWFRLLAGLVVCWPLLLAIRMAPIVGMEALMAPVFAIWALVCVVVGLPYAVLGRVVTRRRGFEPDF